MKPPFSTSILRYIFASCALLAAIFLLALAQTQAQSPAASAPATAGTPRATPQSAPAASVPPPVRSSPIRVVPSSPTTADVEEIVWGVNPLSDQEMNSLMDWISKKMAVEVLPYCYRQSSTRGAGETLTSKCSGDLDKDGQLCYPKCKDGYVGKGPVCWATCPSGFTDIGAFCQKPKEYGRGAGYPAKVGEFNLDKARKRCADDHPEGCEKDGLIIYPKCKQGFHKVGCCICSSNCPSGWSDTGTGCTKPSYGRGAGETLACGPGLEKDGLLCYKPCKTGFHGVGPVCWQNCPSQAPIECGVGCTKSKNDCASDTSEMVISPIMAAISLATFGQASKAEAGVKAAEEGAKIAKNAGKAAKLKKLFESAKTAMSAAKDKLGVTEKMVKNGKTVVKIAKSEVKVGRSVANEVFLYSDAYADDFADQTTQEIADTIDRTFGPEGRLYIKRQWGAHQLNMMLEADGMATARNVMSAVSVADPTGLVSVANAFTHPICANSTPFPVVHPLTSN